MERERKAWIGFESGIMRSLSPCRQSNRWRFHWTRLNSDVRTFARSIGVISSNSTIFRQCQCKSRSLSLKSNHRYWISAVRGVPYRLRQLHILSCLGVGSIGTFLEGPIIGWIVAQYGWSAMFTSMIFLSIFGAIASFRAAQYQRAIKLASASSSSSLEQIVS